MSSTLIRGDIVRNKFSARWDNALERTVRTALSGMTDTEILEKLARCFLNPPKPVVREVPVIKEVIREVIKEVPKIEVREVVKYVTVPTDVTRVTSGAVPVRPRVSPVVPNRPHLGTGKAPTVVGTSCPQPVPKRGHFVPNREKPAFLWSSKLAVCPDCSGFMVKSRATGKFRCPDCKRVLSVAQLKRLGGGAKI